ncbi:MAG: penicillin-binding protein 2 [Desulfovibrionaceae bacterium]|nr:penicillin-binding protein 2 [Desulfovibrionaceae bacterium]
MLSHLDRDDYHPPKNGLLLLLCMVFLLFFVFTLRFWYLQVHKGESYSRQSLDNTRRYERVYASRGLIKDCNGRILADNRPTFVLTLNRESCPDINSTLAQVSMWTGVPLAQLANKVKQDSVRGKAFESIVLLPEMTPEQISLIEPQLLHWPELDIVTRYKRYYPMKETFAHILGYVAEANEKELKSDSWLALGDNVGKQGLEKVLETTLRGQKGRNSLEVDALGRVFGKESLEAPQNGTNITLNIDAELQKNIFSILGSQTGSVVVLNPHTGAVRALVTTPAYDNNLFVSGLSNKDWAALRDNPYHPLQNRAIQSVYPPGSVWKLMMVGLFLEKGISPGDSIYCTGKVTIGNQTFRCWKKAGHGSVSMVHSLEASCDSYYYLFGEKCGINSIADYAKRCGFGSLTQIDLPHEKKGLVPSREWKKRRTKQAWYRGETLNVSIGQGYTLITPIQLATFVGSLLNGGKLLKPQLVAGREPEVIGTTPMSEQTRKLITNAMVLTARHGTARSVRRSDMIIGGKTGTAQVVKVRMIGERRQRKEEMAHFERDHAWIATWGEKNNEQVVVIVMLEHGGGGGSDAGPVAKKVYELLYGPDGGSPRSKG